MPAQLSNPFISLLETQVLLGSRLAAPVLSIKALGSDGFVRARAGQMAQ